MRVAIALLVVLFASELLGDLRLDLLWRGVLCLERSTARAEEGVELVRCESGATYRVRAQLPCSETLACEVGLSCVDEVERIAPR